LPAQPESRAQSESYLEAEERALAARPDDTAARLRFARHCRNVGALSRALTHYTRLIEYHPQALEAAANDLARLGRRYPTDARVAELLAQARARLAAAHSPIDPTQEA
jgi:predicted TPR repeat methyltransferase